MGHHYKQPRLTNNHWQLTSVTPPPTYQTALIGPITSRNRDQHIDSNDRIYHGGTSPGVNCAGQCSTCNTSSILRPKWDHQLFPAPHSPVEHWSQSHQFYFIFLPPPLPASPYFILLRIHYNYFLLLFTVSSAWAMMPWVSIYSPCKFVCSGVPLMWAIRLFVVVSH